MEIVNLIDKFKSASLSTKRVLGLTVVTIMFIALPIFIWAIITQKLFFFKKAASGEPGVCIAYNNTIAVTPVTDTNGTCHDIQTAINSAPSGTTILVYAGVYNIFNTIYIDGKSNLTIEGNVEGSWDEARLNFNTQGWGFKITNSSGRIERMHIEGYTPNGLLSIQNSTNFDINRVFLFGTSSHTFDVQNSSEVSIANSEIKSSAGAVEISQSHNINVLDNRIHNSSTAISVNNSGYVTIMNNLITANSGGGIRLWNVDNTGIYHNTVAYNTGSSPTIDISGTNVSPNVFNQNIVAFNTAAGIVREANANNFSTISYNDVYNNLAGYNYSNMANQTGMNGNISADPKLDTATGYYCLLTGSPAIYGNFLSHEYMGAFGPCTTGTPVPTPNYCSDPFIINMNPQVRNGMPGEKVRFGIQITNNKTNCGSYTTHLIIDKPANWQAEFGTGTFILAPNQTFNTYLDVTSATDNYVLGNNPLAFRISTEEAGYMGTDTLIYNLMPPTNADLIVQDITLEKIFPPSAPCVGYKYTVTVKNIGTENALKSRLKTVITPTQTQAMEAKCETSQPYTGSNAPIPSHDADLYLAPNATETYYDYFNPTSAGKINIVSTIDFDSQVPEKNNDNNTLVKDFDVEKVYPPVTGDVNGDGHVNIVDIGILIDNYRSSPPNDPRADLNNDDVVNIVDIGIVVDNYEL